MNILKKMTEQKTFRVNLKNKEEVKKTIEELKKIAEEFNLKDWREIRSNKKNIFYRHLNAKKGYLLEIQESGIFGENLRMRVYDLKYRKTFLGGYKVIEEWKDLSPYDTQKVIKRADEFMRRN